MNDDSVKVLVVRDVYARSGNSGGQLPSPSLPPRGSRLLFTPRVNDNEDSAKKGKKEKKDSCRGRANDLRNWISIRAENREILACLRGGNFVKVECGSGAAQ